MEKSYFKTLFGRYYNPLTNYAYTIVKDVGSAEDIVQDTFLKIWNDDITLIQNQEGALLFKMVKNKSIDHLRKQSNIRFEEIMETAGTVDIDEEHNIFMLKELIFSLVRQLPTKCQQIFNLSKINGLSYKEIAEELDISVKTVESQMSIAFKKLRVLLVKRAEMLE